MEVKTLNALNWLVEILNKNEIDYQISGGFAAKLYGSSRSLNDIDFEIHDEDFKKLMFYVSEYIKFGPARFKNNKWDCYLITLNYFGQEIDISGADTLRMSNKKRTRWIEYEKETFKKHIFNVEGLDVKVINPNDLIEYKSELDGEHQLVDIAATKEFRLRS